MAVSPEYQRLAMRGLVSELHEMADEGGLVQMTADQIAERVGLCRRVAMRLLKDAEKAGMIWRGIGKVHLKGTGVHLNGTEVHLNGTGVHLKLHGHEELETLKTLKTHESSHGFEFKEKHTHDHPTAKPAVKAAARSPSKPKIDPSKDPGFVEFWTGYPRKVGKAAVAAWWSKTNPDDELLMTILEGLDAWREYWTSREVELRYIPHPMTWLNARRFDDEPS